MLPEASKSRPSALRIPAGLLLASLLACNRLPAAEDAVARDLSCASLPDARSVSLCNRISQRLEYTRGGHAMLFGDYSYHCTPNTVRDLYCLDPRATLEDIDSILAYGKAGHQLAGELDYCLSRLRDAIETAKLPKKERNSENGIICP